MRRGRPTAGFRARGVMAVLTLVGHLIATFGCPAPAAKDASVAYPCQNRPCGCGTAEECWAGDCCCFTLEQKLAWADANGVEPPEHVRPMVAARRAKKAEEPTCSCEESKPCCAEPKPMPAARWVVGVFADKCRAKGPAAAFDAQPSVPAKPVDVVVASSPVGEIAAFEASASALLLTPESPPPRS